MSLLLLEHALVVETQVVQLDGLLEHALALHLLGNEADDRVRLGIRGELVDGAVVSNRRVLLQLAEEQLEVARL